jgi:ferrous iron transport protein A
MKLDCMHNQQEKGVIQLCELENDCPAIIRSVREDNITLKLLEMGFIPGERVVVEHRSVTNDPIAIRISGYLIGLRKDEAQLIYVEKE